MEIFCKLVSKERIKVLFVPHLLPIVRGIHATVYVNCIKDFDQGLEKSKLSNKPILLDFTGWACANCRRVEENTWSVPKVYDLINNEFVLISLYVCLLYTSPSPRDRG